MMEFILTSFHPAPPTYGAVRGGYSFVITLTKGWFHATAKKRGGKIFDGKLVELGYYRQFQEATHACDTYWWKHSQ